MSKIIVHLTLPGKPTEQKEVEFPNIHVAAEKMRELVKAAGATGKVKWRLELAKPGPPREKRDEKEVWAEEIEAKRRARFKKKSKVADVNWGAITELLRSAD